MNESHSYRIRSKRWAEIEKKAWKLSQEQQKIIKPTDIVDAVLFKCVKSVTYEDVTSAKETRE
jgi:hypothetical protein